MAKIFRAPKQLVLLEEQTFFLKVLSNTNVLHVIFFANVTAYELLAWLNRLQFENEGLLVAVLLWKNGSVLVILLLEQFQRDSQEIKLLEYDCWWLTEPLV